MSIELKNVTYTYSQGTAYESHALKDINLVIPDGQFIGVIGHTGSGKSTLIQHFNALIQPTSGQILYNGLASGHGGIFLLIGSGRRIITAGLFEVRWGWYSSTRSTSCLRIQFWQMFALAL